MAFSKAIATLLLLSLLASTSAETYFNKPVPPGVAEALATTNDILCTYLNVNCPPGQSGFTTPPAPPPPAFGPFPSPSIAPGLAPLAAELSNIFGRKLKL